MGSLIPGSMLLPGVPPGSKLLPASQTPREKHTPGKSTPKIGNFMPIFKVKTFSTKKMHPKGDTVLYYQVFYRTPFACSLSLML